MFLCADLDAFFVSVEQTLNPELKGKPVVVGGLPEQRGVVASASYEARQFGIHSGMPTARAYKLCPRAVFLRANFKYYEWYSHRFYNILNNFSPEVHIASIDEAYLNIKGMDRLFGSSIDLARKLKLEIRKKLKIPVSLGIGRTKIFSKIACEVSKPDGLLLIMPGEEIKFIAPLPVSILPGIGKKHLEILNNLNIKTITEFLNTPDWILHTALGNYVNVLNFLLAGGDYKSHNTIKSISRETTLNKDSLNKNLLSAVLFYLIERACQALRTDKLLARTLTLKIRFSDFKTLSKRTSLPLTNAQQVVFNHALPLLDKFLKSKKRIRLIGIALSNLETDELQPRFFREKEERLRKLNYAVDRIRNRFGFCCLNTGISLLLNKHFDTKQDGCLLPTPSLSQ